MEYWFVFLCATYVFFGIDDLWIDLYAWWHAIGPTLLSEVECQELAQAPEKRIAIMIASWKEVGVLRRMISGNQSRLLYRNHEFFLGVYPNDEATVAEAHGLARTYFNVHVVVNSELGPTSKGQMINQVARGILAREIETGFRFDGVLMHDSEDLLHPLSLRLINHLLDRHDFIQIPVFSLPVGACEWVSGTYVDEFSECHTKDILVRNAVGLPIPSAGTGTALTRALLLSHVRRKNGELLNSRSLTEDYELGLSTPRAKARAKFACYFRIDPDGKRDYIATRAYFPKRFGQAIRQKTRWTIGIALQGWENQGWSRCWRRNYFLFRDRKGPAANLLVMAGFLSLPFLMIGDLEIHPAVMAVAGFTFGLMLNRICQRLVATFRVYGFSSALFSPIRLPIGNCINACASARALYQYFVYRRTGKVLSWAKTEHELPDGFGMPALESIEQKAS